MLYQVIRGNGHFRRDIRLDSQLQAAAGTIMAKIAEGLTRRLYKGDGKQLADGFRYTSDNNDAWLTPENLRKMTDVK